MESAFYSFALWFWAIPFAAVCIVFLAIIFANAKTSGEIKRIMPPEMLLRLMAVFTIAGIVFVLAITRTITESTVSALLGALAAGVLGLTSSSKKSDE